MARKKHVERAPHIAGPVVFAVFTSFGAAYIIGAKSFGINALWVTLVPVLLMLGYASALWALRGIRLREDQSGDNFYYMGFIFTLTSLAVSLYQYSEVVGVADIIKNFGVAVASTIAGIVLRIIFNMFRRDPMEVEHHARIELADAARDVRLQLTGLVLEMQHFRRANEQMLSEAFTEIRAHVETSAKLAEDYIGATAKRATDQMEGVAQTDSMGRIRGELEMAAETLAAVNVSLAGMAESINATSRGTGAPYSFGARKPWRSPLQRLIGWFIPSRDDDARGSSRARRVGV